MILEAAPLQVKPGQSQAFEEAFREAKGIIAAMNGFRGLELQRASCKGSAVGGGEVADDALHFRDAARDRGQLAQPEADQQGNGRGVRRQPAA